MGWLSSDGILGDDCYLCYGKETEEFFEDCLWEIHIQGQYSALREYKEAVMAWEKNFNSKGTITLVYQRIIQNINTL